VSRVRTLGLLLASVCLLTSACGGHEVDEDKWRADIEREVGAPVADWPAFRDIWLDICDDDEDQFSTYAAVALDGGDTWDSLRTNVSNACPDRLDELEELRSDLGGVQEACDTPASERTEEQALMAEAMGC
jgi:hypothetical protein